jgi:hypothetical protein
VATLSVDGNSPEVTEIGQTDCGTTGCVFFQRLTVVRRDQPFPHPFKLRSVDAVEGLQQQAARWSTLHQDPVWL